MAVMKEFKPGDRVEYVGGNKEHHGNVFTIVSVHDGLADVGCGHRFTPWTYNLRHIPAPEVITINRDDLVKLAATSDEIISNPGGKYDGILADAAKLRKEKKADVITINRADLPEVRQEGDAVIIVRSKGVIYTANHNPETARASAADFLALAEFLEARQKAAEEAEHKRATRRDELARELAKKAGWTRHATAEYESLLFETQEAIDMMIDLEASHD